MSYLLLLLRAKVSILISSHFKYVVLINIYCIDVKFTKSSLIGYSNISFIQMMCKKYEQFTF